MRRPQKPRPTRSSDRHTPAESDWQRRARQDAREQGDEEAVALEPAESVSEPAPSTAWRWRQRRVTKPETGRGRDREGGGEERRPPRLDTEGTAKAQSSEFTDRRYYTSRRATETFGAHSVNELAQRRAQLRQARRKALVTRLAIVAGMMAVVAAGAWVVFFSSVFALQQSSITVTSDGSRVDTAQVSADLGQWSGTPLPRLSTADLAASVESIPFVHTVTITRDWPHGLKVSIVERQPQFILAHGSQWIVLDSEGVELETVTQRPENLMAVELTVPDGGDRSEAIALISKVRQSLSPALRERVQTMISNGVTVEFRTNDGRLVKWGDDSQGDLKNQVTELLLEQRPAQVYDVSTPARPVTS